MNVKLFEIRDAGTFIPAMAVELDRANGTRDDALLRRAGFGMESGKARLYILLMPLDDGKGHFTYDQYGWGNRTMETAHQYMYEHWDDLKSGDLVDVQFILHETATKKESELACAGGAE